MSSNDFEIKEFIRPEAVKFHIPTFDEIVKVGTEAASESFANELVKLLNTEDSRYLGLEDYKKIAALVSSPGFSRSAVIDIREAVKCNRYSMFNGGVEVIKTQIK